MDVLDILPIVIPGGIMQILIEIYYIKHCWENKTLSQKRKLRFIIAMLIFNIPAAAVYLFLTRKKSLIEKDDGDDQSVDRQIQQGIFVLLIVSYEIFTLRILAQNTANEHYFLMIGLLTACFIIMILNGLLVKKQHVLFYYPLPAIQILLILAVEFYDPTGSAQFLVLAVVAVMINSFSLKPARIYSLIAFGLYLAVNFVEAWQRYGQVNSDEVISSIYANILFFVLVFGAFYMLKKQLLSNSRLEEALATLRQQSLQLEQMGAVAERNRIAGEIHDTVGHTLTSAVIAIEAGEKLVDQDRPAALEKLRLAKDQVRRGLTDIRSSVRAIHSGADQPFAPALDALVAEIRSNTDLAIQAIVDVQSELLPIQQHVLLSAIKECATNSLKHGLSTQADLLIQEFRGNIQLTYRDNGRGTDRIAYGFGLQNMEERVQGLGGTLAVSSSEGEGFVVNISIPAGLKKDGGPT